MNMYTVIKTWWFRKGIPVYATVRIDVDGNISITGSSNKVRWSITGRFHYYTTVNWKYKSSRSKNRVRGKKKRLELD